MANFIGLDKGFLLLSTYNSSAAAGALAWRFVKSTAALTVDLNTSISGITLGVLQGNVDQTKIATSALVVFPRLLPVQQLQCTLKFRRTPQVVLLLLQLQVEYKVWRSRLLLRQATSLMFT